MDCSLVSIYFNSPQLKIKKKKNYKISDYWSRDMLNFNFPEKDLGLVSPPHFVYDFSRKMFFMLYSINWPDFIVWLSLLLEILGNMCTAIVYQPDCDVIKFEINLTFLIKLFCYMTKKSRQKSWERKELLRWNEDNFSSFLIGFKLPKIVSDVTVHLSGFFTYDT